MAKKRAHHSREAFTAPADRGDERFALSARELLAAEERVRHRISAALHNGASQDLLAARIKIALLKEAISSPNHAESLAEIINLVSRAARSISSLTFELCPPLLYEQGLEPALVWLVERFARRHDTTFEFVAAGPSRPMSNEVRGLLFQAVRELLTNVVKHARASNVVIICKAFEGELMITVADDGAGFDPASVGVRDDGTGGFGLHSIRQRLEQLGGRLEIRSAHGRGSRLTAVVPLKEEEDGYTSSTG